jgi:hypothetical protein
MSVLSLIAAQKRTLPDLACGPIPDVISAAPTVHRYGLLLAPQWGAMADELLFSPWRYQCSAPEIRSGQQMHSFTAVAPGTPHTEYQRQVSFGRSETNAIRRRYKNGCRPVTGGFIWISAGSHFHLLLSTASPHPADRIHSVLSCQEVVPRSSNQRSFLVAALMPSASTVLTIHSGPSNRNEDARLRA